MVAASLKTALLDPATWLQISASLDQLLELGPAAREQWLIDLTAREPSIGGVLRILLDAPDDASGLLQSSVDADGIRRALLGYSAQDARAYLQRLSGLAEPASVDMTPAWAPRAFRIDVSVRGPK
jgi:hypothetical protein